MGELRVGEIDSLSGVLAAQGTAVHEGVVYAVSEVNGRGGLRGLPVKLVTRDDAGQPDAATNAAHDLAVREQVSALVGGYVDSIVGPVAQVAERERVPYVASSSLDQRLTQRGNAWFFRISRLEPFVAATTAVPLGILPAREVAILYSSTPGATQLARLQKERLEGQGVRVSAFESFQTGTPDFIPLLARVKASGAKLLLMDGFFADNLVLLRQIHGTSGAVLPVVGAFGMEFPALIRQLGPLGEGAMGAVVWEGGMSLSGDLEGSRAYESGFERQFGHPPAPLSMYGYTATRAVLAALEGATRGAAAPEREAVRDALRRTDLLLPLERLRFDEHGDPLFYQVGIFQIQNGRHVLLYPRERAAGEAISPRP
ncbi:MAG TPA: ABC transporter substrate-binding protein [Thermoanaerobaculia bacterium]|nr:ABC transporter substrate-binding protein [Thermoanaerobaculia bacterium]